jgi:outer membrane lipoprotein SlyB
MLRDRVSGCRATRCDVADMRFASSRPGSSEEFIMNNIVKGAIVVSALLLTAPAFAQNDKGATGGAVGGGVAGAVGGALVGGPIGAVVGGVVGAGAGATVGSLTAEDRTYIQTHVYESDAPNVVVRERVAVGQPLPSSVKVYTFDRPGIDYRYAHVNNQYLLVDAQGNVVGSVAR